MTDEEYACIEEICEAVDKLTLAEKVKLKKFAQFRILAMGRKARFQDEETLLYEAIDRALSGIRKWYPKKASFFYFLHGAIRSISSKDHTKSTYEVDDPKQNTKPITIEFDETKHASKSNQYQELSDKEVVQQVRDLFSGEPLMQDIIDGYMEGMTASEVQAILEISPQKYDACRKKLFRKARCDFKAESENAK